MGRLVGFIGLGNMGGPMARNLVGAGFDLIVTDLDPAKVDALAGLGATEAMDVEGAARDADVVMTSLPGPAHVRQVADRIVPVMRAGSIWIDLSTNDLACARHVAALAAHHGIDVLDAPVTGGIEGAEAGTLNVLVGGDPTVHGRCVDVLAAIGERHELVGPHGAGYVAKIAQVMLCYLNSVCLTEAMMLGVKGGVDPAAMLDIIANSTGRSYVADRYGPEILNGGYDASFDLTLAAKDLRLATELAADVGATIDFTTRVRALYDGAEATFGPHAPHLIAMRTIEDANDLVLHRHDTARNRPRSPPETAMTEPSTPTPNREVTADDFTSANGGSFAGDEWAARVDLAAMYRLAAHFGYDDLVWNHITMRVPGSDHDFFLNKFGLLYNEVTASNLIKVDSDGTVLEGPADVNTAGFVIHSAIHNDFPKWKVVFHAHVPDALAVTALKHGFEHLVQDTSMLYGEIGYHDWEGLSLTLEERERLAANMAGNRALIMRNHGFLTVGETAGEAFMVMHYLIRGCRTLLKAHGSGLDVDPGPTSIWELSKRQYDHFPLGKYEWPALMRLLDQSDASYRQ